MKAFAHLLLPALLIAALASCVATEPRPQVDVERDARALLAQGRYREAAHEYLKLADEARGERADEYRLNAAGALIASFELGAAQALLENSIAGTLPEGLGRKRAALLAEIALAERRSDDVLKLLPPALVAASPPFMARGMRELRSQAYAELGNHLEAAREAVQLEFLGLESTRAAANRRFIWSSLTQLTPSALESARIPPPDTLGGWVELAAITAAFVADYASFKEGVSSWQARFPGHPANAELIGELLEESRAVSTPPVQVALMLPLTGSFADAARAVRDGFVASWFADASSAVRPRIVVHDSGQADVHALFDAAVEGGAEFVVGPLRKSSVSALAENDTLAVPTLALNLATGGQRDAQAMAPDNLYQFALSPEDEARQVAERAWFDGHARVGVLSPQGAWGSRVAQAFTHTWEQLGGVVVEAQVYPTESDDDAQPPNMSQPVETLLNLDESEQRRGALRQVLGRKVHFEPRRRQDVDFIFMAGFPREARQLRPQLKFHHAGDVPVYATSHVFSGVPDPRADADVDDVIFGDMPWVLARSGPDARMRGTVSRLWPQRARTYLRLYAFGADAYRLIVQVRRLRASASAVHEGHTGILWLDERRRVRRRLQWARFADGIPLRLEEASSQSL